MTEIDRRSLMTIAGAGLLMAGSARAQCPPEGNPVGGSCEPHGELVTRREHPEVPNNNNIRFVAAYICVVYVRFTDDKRLKIRTAYVPAPSDSSQVKAVVKPILDKMRNNSHVAAVRKEEDFENFTFGSQQYIVIFVDNDPERVGFDDRFGLANIVRFTPFLGSEPAEDAKENFAFFNLTPLEFDEQGPLRSKVAYQLEFWNTDEEGFQITPTAGCPGTHFIYSMNIHLKIAVRTTAGQEFWVPLILDPDTGNMGGTP